MELCRDRGLRSFSRRFGFTPDKKHDDYSGIALFGRGNVSPGERQAPSSRRGRGGLCVDRVTGLAGFERRTRSVLDYSHESDIKLRRAGPLPCLSLFEVRRRRGGPILLTGASLPENAAMTADIIVGLAFAVGIFLAGFVAGYAVREHKSRKRRRRSALQARPEPPVA